jgi:hypothetical protein
MKILKRLFGSVKEVGTPVPVQTGARYTDSNGQEYVYDGTQWVALVDADLPVAKLPVDIVEERIQALKRSLTVPHTPYSTSIRSSRSTSINDDTSSQLLTAAILSSDDCSSRSYSSSGSWSSPSHSSSYSSSDSSSYSSSDSYSSSSCDSSSSSSGGCD